MDKIQPYLNKYQQSMVTGASVVVLGYASKRFLKKEIVPLGSIKKGLETWVFVSLAGIASQEILERTKKNP